MPVHEYGTMLGTAFDQSTDWTQIESIVMTPFFVCNIDSRLNLQSNLKSTVYVPN